MIRRLNNLAKWPLGALIAPMLAVAIGFFCFAMPVDLLEAKLVSSGVAHYLVPAQPPLSMTDRVVLALLLAMVVGLLTWFVIDRLFYSARSGARRRARRAAYESAHDAYAEADPIHRTDDPILELVESMIAVPAARDAPIEIAAKPDMPRPDMPISGRPLSARFDIGDPPECLYRKAIRPPASQPSRPPSIEPAADLVRPVAVMARPIEAPAEIAPPPASEIMVPPVATADQGAPALQALLARLEEGMQRRRMADAPSSPATVPATVPPAVIETTVIAPVVEVVPDIVIAPVETIAAMPSVARSPAPSPPRDAEHGSLREALDELRRMAASR